MAPPMRAVAQRGGQFGSRGTEMGWQKRRNGGLFFYHSVRRGETVHRVYFGCGVNAMVASYTLQAISEARCELKKQQKAVRDGAAVSSSKLDQLLKIPIPQLAELLNPTRLDRPILTTARRKLVAGSSPQQLGQWGHRALRAHVALMSGGASARFEKLMALVAEKTLTPPHLVVHPVLVLHYERHLLALLQQAYCQEMAERPVRSKKVNLWERRAIVAGQKAELALDTWHRVHLRAAELPLAADSQWISEPNLGRSIPADASPDGLEVVA